MKYGMVFVVAALALLGFSLAGFAGVVLDPADGDGIPDFLDNCTDVTNGPPADCDTDGDGFGNACDGDFDQTLVVDAADFLNFFLPDFATGIDSGTGTDMDCSGVVDATDFLDFLLANFTQGFPGPSGLVP